MNEPTWKQPDGDPVSCIEKLEVLNENYRELCELMQDVFEDALLMDCDDEDIKQAFHKAVEKLQNPYHPVGRPLPPKPKSQA